MLIIRSTGEGSWFDFKTRGETIRLKIRVTDADVIAGLRKSHRRTEFARDTDTRKMVKVEVFDEDAITEALIDHVLMSFEGIGDEAGTLLSVTIENKKKVMNIPPAQGEQSIVDFVFENAREIAAAGQEDIEKQIKNS